MLLKLMKRRLVVLPLATFFLLFSGGAAVAPECHIEMTSHTHVASVTPHSHSTPAIDYELCLTIGFVALLIFRFLQVKRSSLTLMRITLPMRMLPPIRSLNLSFLNLTHLQLGIIRV